MYFCAFLLFLSSLKFSEGDFNNCFGCFDLKWPVCNRLKFHVCIDCDFIFTCSRVQQICNMSNRCIFLSSVHCLYFRCMCRSSVRVVHFWVFQMFLNTLIYDVDEINNGFFHLFRCSRYNGHSFLHVWVDCDCTCVISNRLRFHVCIGCNIVCVLLVIFVGVCFGNCVFIAFVFCLCFVVICMPLLVVCLYFPFRCARA